MPLILAQQAETDLPLDLQGVLPEHFCNSDITTISRTPIRLGRHAVELGELFSVSGQCDDELHLRGDFSHTHNVGSQMSSGLIRVEGSAGQQVGSRMSGGFIHVAGDAGDFLGSEMTGGRVAVNGKAGDHVGASFPGAKIGMNRGEIFVQGDVGGGCGLGMRRGTIVVGGDAGKLLGMNMRAGTIVVFGTPQPLVGAQMIRGTIVLAHPELQSVTEPTNTNDCEFLMLPTFLSGQTATVPFFGLLARWLSQAAAELGMQNSVEASKLKGIFEQFHGDSNHGGRGEVFLAR